MFVYALSVMGSSPDTMGVSFSYRCTTENEGTPESPRQEEICSSQHGSFEWPGESLVAGLSGIGLMLGSVAVSIGSPRRQNAAAPAAYAAPQGPPAPMGGPGQPPRGF
ncbi:hypothetical protein SAMN05421773_113156 [Streptomyces aidingensis]|uniref:Uncharacterized protein n=2 Tax=Streptomyces aidingensis TaxID=910347 RepID=A0A1I1RW99_9ACTN|nr:hypothetical protein SAMN05421773_113156 [Streptomyces aidingensis]